MCNTLELTWSLPASPKASDDPAHRIKDYDTQRLRRSLEREYAPTRVCCDGADVAHAQLITGDGFLEAQAHRLLPLQRNWLGTQRECDWSDKVCNSHGYSHRRR
jgi:hypothetical protein